MAKGFDITLAGGAELAKKFKGLTLKMQKLLLRKAMKPAAEPVAASAASRAPVDTGALAASIHVGKPKMRKGSLKITIETGSREDLGIDPDATGFYPMAQETGWVDADGKHHAAQPYLRPALHENESRVLSTIGSKIASNMEDLAK